MSRSIELYGPFLLSGTVVILSFSFASKIPPVSGVLCAGTMTLGVVVAGFTATQRNMLLSMGGSRVMRFAADTTYYRDVLTYLVQCIYASLFVVVISLIGAFITKEMGVWRYWLAFWSGSVFLLLALMIRNELLMSRIFSRFMEGQSSRKN